MISGSTAMARAMLLAAREAERAGVQAVADFLPQRGTAKTALDRLVKAALFVDALEAQAVDDIFVDRFRKRIRFLEDHADALAQLDDVDGGIVDIDARNLDRTRADTGAVDEVVHAIETAQEGRFAAAGRADKGGDELLLDGKIDPVERLALAVIKIDMVDVDERRRVKARGLLRTGRRRGGTARRHGRCG
jgi:hypothetical protein